ncbi:MAG: serine/threonine-protein kinase [Bacteroidota bacterium]
MTKEEFFTRFEFGYEDTIGSGGFAKVYRAWDKVEKKHVAIKRAEADESKFTLRREAALINSLESHDNLIRFKEYEGASSFRFKEDFDLYDYAVMDYYESGNLQDILTHFDLKFEDKKNIIEGILKGYAHLHHKLTHRDTKASNILMAKGNNGEWIPKISDFGLCQVHGTKDIDRADSATHLTYEYAAPEQFLGGKIKNNVDLWSCGVIIYRILTGELPFQVTKSVNSQEKRGALIRMITQVELPETQLSYVSEPYQEIIRRCLVKDNKKRVQKADDLLEILSEGQEMNEETIVKPTQKIEHFNKPNASNKRQNVWLAAILLLFLIGTGFFLITNIPNENKNENTSFEREYLHTKEKLEKEVNAYIDQPTEQLKEDIQMLFTTDVKIIEDKVGYIPVKGSLFALFRQLDKSSSKSFKVDTLYVQKKKISFLKYTLK